MTPDERTYLGTGKPDRVIVLSGPDRMLLIDALLQLGARSDYPGDPALCLRLAQRIEGHAVDGRPGSRVARPDE